MEIYRGTLGKDRNIGIPKEFPYKSDAIDPFFENKKIEVEYHKAQECFSDALEDTEESNFDKAKEIKENFKKYLEKESSANEEEIRDYVDRHFVIGDEDFEELE